MNDNLNLQDFTEYASKVDDVGILIYHAKDDYYSNTVGVNFTGVSVRAYYEERDLLNDISIETDISDYTPDIEGLSKALDEVHAGTLAQVIEFPQEEDPEEVAIYRYEMSSDAESMASFSLKSEYFIATGVNPNVLMENVNAKLSEEWEVHGSMVFDGNLYIQPMTKETVIDES